ncbi:LamG-like jellyroll fold domain-containing protein [Bacteroides sp.]
MKNLFCLFMLLIYSVLAVNGRVLNQTLKLDGKDSNVRTGIGILSSPWTLEAWIKGDDTVWKETEVIFGGGEYSAIDNVDYLPLVLRNGKLHNTRTGLTASLALNNDWHHVALTCDGRATVLYQDGVLVGKKDTVIAVLPGALGVNETAESVFGGCMDEVRIWTCALSEKDLRSWMNIPLTPSHPQFSSLLAYYNFDEGIDDMAVNWVGRGAYSYHLRNGRVDYKGTTPLAITVKSDNKRFHEADSRQQLFSAMVIHSEWDADQGAVEDPICKLRIAVTGSRKPLSLNELVLDLSETTDLKDLSAVHVYYVGQKARSSERLKLSGSSTPNKRMIFKGPEGKAIELKAGTNYFLVTADISCNARLGNQVKIGVSIFQLGNREYVPSPDTESISKLITGNSRQDSAVFKMLQWNIWHGGIHLGDRGRDRIVELIKASKADVVTMQEGYGCQERIARETGLNMQTPSLKDNLVLFSRFPLTAVPSSGSFYSNPALLSLPGNRSLLVDACWLPYAYNPEYTGCYPNPGQDTNLWIAEDSVRALAKIRQIVEKDAEPYSKQGEIPVIIGGDFNSCSHLDWTAVAAHLHYGYGSVQFPVSRFLYQKGYKDSFRELNPDEVKRGEGTFADIYGQLHNNRIDFIYYKGKRLRAISSKIIRTSPEIDDVWASDHSAVLTVFEYK